VDQAGWFDYFARTLQQLLWWAQASEAYRSQIDPHQMIGDFNRDPAQRNAPQSD